MTKAEIGNNRVLIRGRHHRLSGWRFGAERLIKAFVILTIASTVASYKANAQFTRFQNYTDEQGLGTLDVTSFAQSKAGNILFGTEGGLYEYDGTRITPFTAPGLPPASVIHQIAFDDDDRLWVMTADRVFVRDGAAFRAFDTGHVAFDDGAYHLLALNKGGAVLDAGGNLLRIPFGRSRVGTPSPIFSSEMTTSIPGLAKARFVVPDGGNGLLIGCGRLLCISSQDRVVTLGSEVELPNDEWSNALRAPDGVLWVRSLDHLAWRNPGEASFHSIEVPGHSGSYFAGHPGQLDLVSDGRGGVFTEGDGDLLDFEQGSWKKYDRHAGGLPANVVHGLFVDREQSLWLGSEGGGAFRSIGLGAWEHWTADDGLPNDTIWSMTRLRDGQFWVSTDGGSVSLNEKHERVAGSTYALAESRAGRLWLAPFGGSLLRLDAQAQTKERVAFAPAVLTATVDADDRLWLGTRKGLFLISNADGPIADVHPALVLPAGKMEVVTDPSGTIWAAGPSGVFRLGMAGVFQPVLSAKVLDSPPLDLAFAPDGAIWIATAGTGIQRFRISANSLLSLPSIRSPTIASDSILFLHRDRSNRLWVGSDHGIDMFDGQSWRRLDSSQGPISNDMDQTSVYEDIDGSMWFGTSHGLSHLRAADHLAPQATLHPRVISISLGGRILPLSPKIGVKWSTAPLVIRFADLDYAQGAVSFRYRLRGLDAGWSDTVAHEVRYANVPAGKFTFELLAVSGAQGVTSTPVGFEIRVSTLWWHHWWFLGFCTALATLGVVGAWQIRIRFLLKQRSRLEELVHLRTAEIEHAKQELEHRSALEQERLHGEQRRLEEMVIIRTAEIEQARSELQRLALSDVLTGLANRRAVMNALDEAVALAQRLGDSLAVLLCDIDNFKKINDNFGHPAGDAVLVEFGNRLGRVVVRPGLAGRYGGEEFLLLLSGDRDTIMRHVLEIQLVASNPSYVIAGETRTVTFSGGVAFFQLEDSSATMIARADAALYVAKKKGRNRIIFEDDLEHDYDEKECLARNGLIGPYPGVQALEDPPQALNDNAVLERLFQSRRLLELDLRAALRDGEFLLHFQPIVNVATNTVTACEALLRWHSPARGNVPPAEFIPFAEEIGLMPEIGDWVLQTACQEASAWRSNQKISVNLSPMQFRLPDLVSRILTVLEKTGLPPSRLELEVTETAMINDITAAATILRELRTSGITVALDDFGTGYSSLSFLRMLPFDRVKIDRSFIQDLGNQSEALAIVRAVAGLCSSLGAGVTAEGVETDRQIDLLREAGCTEIQGFRISRPCPSAELDVWMNAFAASRRHVVAKGTRR